MIDEAKKLRIQLALDVFVTGNTEAAVREMEGITKTDMFVKACLKAHSLARTVFHAEEVKRIEALAAKATVPEKALNLQFQAERARTSGAHEGKTIASVRANFEEVWPNEDGPTVSKFEAPLQKKFIKAMRKTGYADNTIAMFLSYIFAAISHCDGEGLLLLKVPKRLRKDKWAIATDEERDVQACTLEEFGKLMATAAEREEEWRYMHCEISGARSNTIAEAVWECIEGLGTRTPRWRLNPPGKRLTKKRRPVIAICPTLAAEMLTWERDSYRIISDGNGNPVNSGPQLFIRIRDRAGLPHVTAKSLRAFIRTWLMLCGVPDAIADMFVGHADEGSVTGRKFYKVKDPKYQQAVMVALEKLYQAIRPMVPRPIAIPSKQPTLTLVSALADAA